MLGGILVRLLGGVFGTAGAYVIIIAALIIFAIVLTQRRCFQKCGMKEQRLIVLYRKGGGRQQTDAGRKEKERRQFIRTIPLKCVWKNWRSLMILCRNLFLIF